MKIDKTTKLFILIATFVTAILAANIMAVKLFSFFGLALTAGILAYPVTFLMTDVIGEVWGKKMANRTVILGLLGNLLMIGLLSISIALKPIDFWPNQEAYASILGSVPRIVLASIAAYIASQFLDVHVFHQLKKKHGTKKLWLRNNVSTITSQAVDTVIFITIAFVGVMPFSALLTMMGLQYVLKFVIALIDTPLCYGLVKWIRSGNNESSDDIT